MPSWKKIITSGSSALLLNVTASSFTGSFTGSFLGTGSYATNALSASYVNTLNQNVIISGSLAVGTSSLGPSENTLTLGARDSSGEGGQLGFNASGGTYTSASMLDNYQNRFRILRGSNAGSNAEIASWNLDTKQMFLPSYNNVSAYPGTAVATLGVNASGDVITTSPTPTTSGFTGIVTIFGNPPGQQNLNFTNGLLISVT